MSYKIQLLKKLNNHTARIGIIGLGYVGLRLALTYSKAGFRVLGFDIDGKKTETLNRGGSYIERIKEAEIANAREYGFEATSDFSASANCDVLIICVPTHLTQYREPDLSPITNTLESLRAYFKAGQIVSFESTTYPGTTAKEVLPRLESRDLSIGEDIFVAYSPEREKPGNKEFETQTIPKIVGGHTKCCLEIGSQLYGHAINNAIPISSAKDAEMSKLLENTHRAVNIEPFNEMKLVTDRMGIDIFEMIDAAAKKPFGFTPYYPGPSLGGHCIPKTPTYLTWKAKEYGTNTHFIELSDEINHAMPESVVSKLTDVLIRIGNTLNGIRILILGITYKKNMDELRESPAVEIMKILDSKGVRLAYTDPQAPVFPRIRKAHYDMTSTKLTPASIARFDAVTLTTNHDILDHHLIRKHAKLNIDMCGAYREKGDNIFSRLNHFWRSSVNTYLNHQFVHRVMHFIVRKPVCVNLS